MLTNAMTWMNPENLLSETSHLACPGGLWELDDTHTVLVIDCAYTPPADT